MPYLSRAAELAELYGDSKIMRDAATLTGQAYYAMGVNAFNAEDYPKAIEVFSQGYVANPTNTELGMALAESYAKSGDLENGMKVYGEIAALESRHSRYAEVAAEAKTRMAEYLMESASLLAQDGKIEEAYVVIDEILAFDATNAIALMMRLQLAYNAKQYANVIQWGEATAEAQSDAVMKSNAYFLFGAAYQNSEKLDDAIVQYNKVTDGQYVSSAKTQITEIRKAQAAATK
jgi:tetratricopeptide (TPR) repeat protein